MPVLIDQMACKSLSHITFTIRSLFWISIGFRVLMLICKTLANFRATRLRHSASMYHPGLQGSLIPTHRDQVLIVPPTGNAQEALTNEYATLGMQLPIFGDYQFLKTQTSSSRIILMVAEESLTTLKRTSD